MPGRGGVALVVRVYASHDTHQSGLSRPIIAEDTDLGPGIERKIYVL
jgi:hypothetical protein